MICMEGRKSSWGEKRERQRCMNEGAMVGHAEVDGYADRGRQGVEGD